MKRNTLHHSQVPRGSGWTQPRQVPRAHYEELVQHLGAKEDLGTLGTADLAELTPQQFLELSTDVYDELVRRKKNSSGTSRVLPYLPPRQDFSTQRNDARQSLASSPEFQKLPGQIYHELAKRHPEFYPKSSDTRARGSTVSSDFPALSNTPRSSIGALASTNGRAGSSYASDSTYASSASSRRSSHDTTPTSEDVSLRSSHWTTPTSAWSIPQHHHHYSSVPPPRMQRLHQWQEPPLPLPPIFNSRRPLAPNRAPGVSCRSGRTPPYRTVAFGMPTIPSSAPIPAPDAQLRHQIEDARHLFTPFSVGSPSRPKQSRTAMVDLTDFQSTTTIFGTSVPLLDVSMLAPEHSSHIPYPGSTSLSPLPHGGISPLPLGDLQAPYMGPSHVQLSQNGVLSQPVHPPSPFHTVRAAPEYEYTRPQGEYTPDFEVQDFGYGFGVVSGTGYAPVVTREERMAREREQRLKDGEVVDDLDYRSYGSRSRRGSFSTGPRRGGRGSWGRGGGFSNYYRQPPPPFSVTPPSGHYHGPPSPGEQYYSGQTYIPTGFEFQAPPPPAFAPPIQPPVPMPLSDLSFPLDPIRWHLLGQLEYYLSPQNMATDFYLRQRMDSRGWIHIPLLASFRRIQQLTMDASLVKEVLKLSNVLEVFDDSVRMTVWEQFVLPNAPLSIVEGLVMASEPQVPVVDPLSLLGQLEYYLGAQNMALDFYLRQQMDSRGWIHIPLIAAFARIRQLTMDLSVVKETLAKSTQVEMKDDFVRMKGWEQYVLPNAPASNVEQVAATIEEPEEDSVEYVYEDDDDDEEDVVFVMGHEAAGHWTPERR